MRNYAFTHLICSSVPPADLSGQGHKNKGGKTPRVIHVKSLDFGGEVSGLCTPSPCAISPEGETKSPDFRLRLRISPDLHVIHLKVTKFFVLQQSWLGPSQLLGTSGHVTLTVDII